MKAVIHPLVSPILFADVDDKGPFFPDVAYNIDAAAAFLSIPMSEKRARIVRLLPLSLLLFAKKRE